ncbi:hypothetical protein [Serratia ureilytica]|uniref:hypothetical protein n=1 Tax=Serratia ureilytica TaxID=300181 RepID=UPI001AA1C706|nr:hypothetical protein [Serratia ureilytica]
MDNKLSELSKPVAYDYQIADACIADGHNENGKWVDWNNKLSRYCPPDWMVEEGKVTELKPLYSQEYVSALTQRAERLDSILTESVQALKAVEQRNAELEAKLATPVQLQNCDFESVAIMAHWCTDEQLKAWVKGVEHAKKQIRAAGFKVEGDE